MKIVYMGTPDFAVDALEAIVNAGLEVVAVVTQPDKEKGRGKTISISPVKECANRHGIEVFQPIKIREKEAVAKLKSYEADMFVVAAFGQILSKEVLDIPRYGCINIHASLLPAYRGAAPIQWAILDGLSETGVTIMHMDEGIDTGDILLQKKLHIEETDTGEGLFNKLSKLGAEAIVEAIPMIVDGTISHTKQDDALSSYAKMLTKKMGRISWADDADRIERYVRGLNSWPSAYTYLDGKQLKIWQSAVKKVSEENQYEAGTVISVDDRSFTVKCGHGALEILQVQLEGKKRMNVDAFINGYRLEVGKRFE